MFMQICVYSIIWYFVLTTTKQQKYFIHTIQVQREVKKKNLKKFKKRGKKLQVKRGTKEVNNN